MSFQISKFTASTWAAINIFHLFQNGLVNMVTDLEEDGGDVSVIYKRHRFTAKDGEFQRWHLEMLIQRLSWYVPSEVEVKVHNLTAGGYKRKVEFSMTRDGGRTKTTFVVNVASHNAVWVLYEAKLIHMLENCVMEAVIKPVPANAAEMEKLPDQVAQYIRGFVRIESSTF